MKTFRNKDEISYLNPVYPFFLCFFRHTHTPIYIYIYIYIYNANGRKLNVFTSSEEARYHSMK